MENRSCTDADPLAGPGADIPPEVLAAAKLAGEEHDAHIIEIAEQDYREAMKNG